MRRIALMVALLFGFFVSSASAAERRSCVPARGFETRLAMGRTRFFSPPANRGRLLVCRPGHPTVSLIGSALPYTDGSSGGARIGRHAGRYVEVSWELHDGNTDTDYQMLIDSATYRFADVGFMQTGYGQALAFSADGWAAAVEVTPTSLGLGPVLIPGPDGSLSVQADPGPARHLTVHGSTARWIDEPGDVMHTLALKTRPRYAPFPSYLHLSARQLAHVPHET